MLTAAPSGAQAQAQGACTPDTTLVRTAWRTVPFALSVVPGSRTSETDSIVEALARVFEAPARVQQVLPWETTDAVLLPVTPTAREVPQGRLVLDPAPTGGPPAIVWLRPVLASGIMTALEAAAARLPKAHWPALPITIDVGLQEPGEAAVHALGSLPVQFLFVTAQAYWIGSTVRMPRVKRPYRIAYEVIIDPDGRVVPGSWRKVSGEAAVEPGIRKFVEGQKFSPARIGRCAVAQMMGAVRVAQE